MQCETPTEGKQSKQDNKSSMVDEIVAIIISTNDKVEGAPSVKDSPLLNHLLAFNESKLLSFTSDGLDPLAILDPSVHSLGYLFFLTERCAAVKDVDNAQHLVHRLSVFLNQMDPSQVRLAPKKISLLAQGIQNIASILNQPILAVQLLLLTVHRLAYNPCELSSLHAPLAQACLQAKMYKAPLSFFDHDITEIDTTSHDISICSFLLYHYYGSMIYIGNKNFERALDFLILVISAPAQIPSAIQLEAYKKFILVSLILDGNVRKLPKYTSMMVDKAFRGKHGNYLELAKAFENGIPSFEKALQKHATLLASDSHTGLAKQCLQALRRKAIKNLSSVYITISLSDIVAELNGKTDTLTMYQVELMLLDLIAKGEIRAVISTRTNGNGERVKMVHFPEEESIDSPDTQQHLRQRLRDAALVGKTVSQMEKAEGMTKDFQSKYMIISANGGQIASFPSYDEDIEFPLDEDSNRSFA